MNEYRRPTFSRFPPVVKNLLMANVVIFIVTLFLLYSPSHIDITQSFGLYYFGFPNFRIYQLVTCMFLHTPDNYFHIIFNMFALWMFGSQLENLWGSKRFLIFYFICGIGASLSQEVAQFFHVMSIYSFSIGASGAVYGVLLAYGMTFPNTELFIMFIPFPIKAKYAVILFGAIELFAGIAKFSGDNIAHFVHLGGMLFGLIVMLYWRRKSFR